MLYDYDYVNTPGWKAGVRFAVNVILVSATIIGVAIWLIYNFC